MEPTEMVELAYATGLPIFLKTRLFQGIISYVLSEIPFLDHTTDWRK